MAGLTQAVAIRQAYFLLVSGLCLWKTPGNISHMGLNMQLEGQHGSIPKVCFPSPEKKSSIAATRTGTNLRVGRAA